MDLLLSSPFFVPLAKTRNQDSSVRAYDAADSTENGFVWIIIEWFGLKGMLNIIHF